MADARGPKHPLAFANRKSGSTTVSAGTTLPPAGPLRQVVRAFIALGVAVVCAAASGCGDGLTSEQRAAASWANVQQEFNGLARFELQFRTDAIAAAGKREDERLRFVRGALEQRLQLRTSLKRALQGFTKKMSGEQQALRVAYSRRMTDEMAKLESITRESGPAAATLKLRDHDADLRAFETARQAQLDAMTP
jgi:hypothetical protein